MGAGAGCVGGEVMRNIIIGATLVVASLSVATASASERSSRRIATLAAEAAVLKAKGDAVAARTRVAEAVALAERDPGRNQQNLFEALNATTKHIPDNDFEQQYAVYARLAPLAAQVKGADSFDAWATLAGRNVLAFVLRKPGASIPAFADALAKATPLAVDERDKAQMVGLTMVLAQLYDATGQHDRAVQTVASAAEFYDAPPVVPSDIYSNGLMTLAQRYADWQDWPKALDAADRAIVASVAFHGRRTADLVTALKVRGGVHSANARYGDAERDYREAVALADTAPSPAVQSGALLNLARLYVLTGRDALARPLFERAAEVARALPPQSNTRLVALLDLYNMAMRASDLDGATRYARAARDDADARGFGGGPNYVTVLLAISNASLRAGDADAAARTLADVESLLPKAVPPKSSRYADLMSARAKLAMMRGDIPESVRQYRAAIERWAQSPTGDKTQVAVTRAMLTESLARTGDIVGAWRSSRQGATEMTDVIIARGAGGNREPIDRSAMTIFETAIEAAWNVRHAR